ncbi:hypothetical protein ACFL27_12035 [candidate division CSSED10-310 bacterium]|uniref:Uncharacterized protein n=1 Tax=candidate division CSSED10-310 bacterium TaxID=2855610 RepID=A0ABV6YXJ2_UNCC1
MKRINKYFLHFFIFVTVVFVTSKAFAVENSIGVLPLSVQGHGERDSYILAELIRDTVFEERGNAVLDGQAMQDLLMSYPGQTACADYDCARKVGQYLNVDTVIYGIVKKTSAGYEFFIYLFTRSKHPVPSSESGVTGDSMNELIQQLILATKRLIGSSDTPADAQAVKTIETAEEKERLTALEKSLSSEPGSSEMKKPWFKKWWPWTIGVAVLGVTLYSLGDSGGSGSETEKGYAYVTWGAGQ